MNGEYMRMLSPEKIMEYAMPFIKEAGLDMSKGPALLDLIKLEHEKFHLLTDVPKRLDFFYKDPVYDQEAVEKVFRKPEVPEILKGISELYSGIEMFKAENIEPATRAWAKEHKFKNGQVFHPVRVALSGRTDGPTLFKMIEYIGRSETIKRLAKALEMV